MYKKARIFSPKNNLITKSDGHWFVSIYVTNIFICTAAIVPLIDSKTTKINSIPRSDSGANKATNIRKERKLLHSSQHQNFEISL